MTMALKLSYYLCSLSVFLTHTHLYHRHLHTLFSSSFVFLDLCCAYIDYIIWIFTIGYPISRPAIRSSTIV